MNIFDNLTELDKKTISSYISHYAVEEKGFDEANLAHVLRIWAKNKEKLYHSFGDKFIVSREFSYEQSFDEICEKTTKLIYQYDNFVEQFSRWVNRTFPYTPSWPFLTDLDRQTNCKYNILCRLLQSDTLAENNLDIVKCAEDYFGSNSPLLFKEIAISLPSGKVYKLSGHENKPMRILARINKEFNLISEEEFEEFRIAHSMIFNQKRIKGVLNLSIHPMDYMTMSDNVENWSSCMSWQNEGEYRQGTVEMMNSPHVIVAYISSDNNMTYCGRGYEWNSKKWRCLCLVDKDSIVSVKNYPYFNKDITAEALSFIKEIVEQNEVENKYYPELINFNSNCHLKEGEKPYIKFFASGHMYCDFCCINGTDAIRMHWGYFSESLINHGGYYELDYSGASECIICGSTEDTVDDSLVCEDCSNETRTRCCDCGECVYDGDMFYDQDGNPYCESCYYEHYYSCTSCGMEEDVDYYHSCSVEICKNSKSMGVWNLCRHCYEKLKPYLTEEHSIDIKIILNTPELSQFRSDALWYERCYTDE